jgi:hypothetical protein
MGRTRDSRPFPVTSPSRKPWRPQPVIEPPDADHTFVNSCQVPVSYSKGRAMACPGLPHIKDRATAPGKADQANRASGRRHGRAATGLQARGRGAPTATDSASFGSLLPVPPAWSSRIPARRVWGCTSSASFPGGNELLGRQPAEPAGSLDAPGPFRPLRRPTQQVPGPAPAQASTRILPTGSSAAFITTAVCDPLCESTPIITVIASHTPRDNQIADNSGRGGN